MQSEDEILASIAKYISKKEREGINKKYFGDPENLEYPARNQKEFDDAVRLSGRSKHKSKEAIQKRLKEIAKREGYTLPESWK